MGLRNQINAGDILYSKHPIRSDLDGGRPFKYLHTASWIEYCTLRVIALCIICTHILYLHRGDVTIVPVPLRQDWRICVDESHESNYKLMIQKPQ